MSKDTLPPYLFSKTPKGYYIVSTVFPRAIFKAAKADNGAISCEYIEHWEPEAINEEDLVFRAKKVKYWLVNSPNIQW